MIPSMIGSALWVEVAVVDPQVGCCAEFLPTG